MTIFCTACAYSTLMALFVLSHCPFDISVGVGAFVIGLSQISSFFSWYVKKNFRLTADRKYVALVLKVVRQEQMGCKTKFKQKALTFWLRCGSYPSPNGDSNILNIHGKGLINYQCLELGALCSHSVVLCELYVLPRNKRA